MAKKLKLLPLNLRTRQGRPLFHLFNIVLEILDTAIRHEKEIKGIYVDKEGANLSLFLDDVLYIENPKYALRKLLSSSTNSVNLQDIKLIHRNLLSF